LRHGWCLFPYTTLFRSSAQRDALGPLLLRPVHREHEDADSLQRRGEPADLLGDVGDPPHEFVRLDAAPALLLRRTGRLETPRDRSEEHTSELQSPCNLV